MTNLKIFCVSDIPLNNLENLDLDLVGVGKKTFSSKYISCNDGINIQNKEQYYSELTFHFWFWKNMLPEFNDNTWIGFCQKRRFWIKENSSSINNIEDLKKNLLREIPKKWEQYDAFICDPIRVSPVKKIKMIKKGWRNLLKDPSIFFNKNKQNLKLQFDMFHGHGILEKAIKIISHDDKKDFMNYINNKTEFNPHIMVIAKKQLLKKWFESLFDWLFECEKIFGFKDLVGYEKKRLYAFLAERYLSFWFNKYCKVKNSSWIFYDTT